MKEIFSKKSYDPEIIQELGRIDLVAKVLASGLQLGAHKSMRHGFSTEFSEYKSYQNYDDPRLIDWLLYGRTDKLYVKKFEAETDVEVRMLLDASASMAWRFEAEVNKYEYATNLLATLAQLHIGQMNKVGFFLQGEGDAVVYPPRCQRTQLDLIFSALASAEAGGENCFSELCETFSQNKRHRGMTIIFSDLEENLEDIEKSMDLLGSYKDDVVIVHLLHELEIDLPFDDATHLEDSETGELLKVDKRFKENHKKVIDKFREDIQNLCSEKRIAYVGLDTSMNYFDAIMKFVEITRSFFAQV